MKSLLLFVTATMFMLAGCRNAEQNSGHDHATDAGVQTEVKTDANAESHEGHDAQVLLDNGKKWKANPETVDGIANMEAIIAKAKTDNAAPTTLYEPLAGEFKNIFDKCTMTGEAHNQLHNYLVPIKNELDKIKVEQTAQEGLANLDAHLKTFGNYFEL